MKLTHEIIEKVRTAKSSEELLLLAKEHGIAMTADEANTYFEQINDSRLDDDLLEGVSGGWIVGGSGEESATEVLRKNSSRKSHCE